MVKTFGSRDLRRRKTRSDKGKRRRFYKGRRTKPKRKMNGKFVPYKSKRKAWHPIKVWFQEKKRMSKTGYMKWSPKIRGKIDKTIKCFIDKPVYVNPHDISNPEKMGEFAIQVLQYPGLFNWLMCSHAKNHYRKSYKLKARVKITETTEGLHADVFDFNQMRHYKWFWSEKTTKKHGR